MNNMDDYMEKNKIDAKNRAMVRFYKQLPEDVKSDFMSYEEFVREMIEVDESHKKKTRENPDQRLDANGNPLSSKKDSLSGRKKNFFKRRISENG